MHPYNNIPFTTTVSSSSNRNGGDAACRHMQCAVDLLLASANHLGFPQVQSRSQLQLQPLPQPQPRPQQLLSNSHQLLPQSLPRSSISNNNTSTSNAAIRISPAESVIDWTPPQAQSLISTTTPNNASAANAMTNTDTPKTTERRTTRTSSYLIEADIITIPKCVVPLRDIETPHENDVLSGRGQSVNYHSGNQHFRHLVRSLKMEYLNSNKRDKPRFAERIVDSIRNLPGQPGRFLKQDKNGLWYDIGDKKACLKTRQSLREGAPQFLKPVSKFKCSNSTSSSSISTPSPSSSSSPITVTSGLPRVLHKDI